MKYKYLSDGKKVVVIGQLNNVESIVQEVFVTDGGDEIPSGEKFTTKNLHDEPVISWKIKEETKLETRLQRVNHEIKNAEREQNNVRIKLKGLEAIFRQSRLLSESLEGQNLDTLISVMSGACEYLVLAKYGFPEIVKFDDTLICRSDNQRYESLKLLTLMGSTDGNLSFRISNYSDGIGGSDTVIPCPNKEAALDKVNELCTAKMESGRFPSVIEYKRLKDMGVLFDKPTTAKIKAHILAAFAANAGTAKEKYEEGRDKEKAAEKEAKALFA